MGTIKDIYDLAKDVTKLTQHIKAIKRALKIELKLNSKFLADIEKDRKIDDIRRKKIINNLKFNELSDAVKYDIPYNLICSKTVSVELARKLKVKRIKDYNFEKLIENLYIMITFLKDECDNNNIDLNSRLIFIYKYNKTLLMLLS